MRQKGKGGFGFDLRRRVYRGGQREMPAQGKAVAIQWHRRPRSLVTRRSQPCSHGNIDREGEWGAWITALVACLATKDPPLPALSPLTACARSLHSLCCSAVLHPFPLAGRVSRKSSEKESVSKYYRMTRFRLCTG